MAVDPDALLEEAMNELLQPDAMPPAAAAPETSPSTPRQVAGEPAPETYHIPPTLWWTQNDTRVELHIQLPADANPKSKDITVDIKPQHIKVTFRGEPLADWELAEQVVAGDDAEWDLVEVKRGQKAVRLELPKKVPKRLWDFVATIPFTRPELIVDDELLRTYRREDEEQAAKAKEAAAPGATAGTTAAPATGDAPAAEQPAEKPAESGAGNEVAVVTVAVAAESNLSEEPYTGVSGEGLDPEVEEELPEDKSLDNDELLTEGWRSLERGETKRGLHYLRVGALERNSMDCVFSLIKLYQKPSGPSSQPIPGVHAGPHRVLWFLFHGARLGNKDLMCQLGKCYEVGALTVVPSFPTALRWYQAAAGLGEGTSIVRLARLHMTGGCSKDDPLVKQRSNPRKAQAIMGEALSRGVLEAHRLMMHWYIEGRPLYDPSVEKMEELWEKLNKGHPGFLDMADMVARTKFLREQQPAPPVAVSKGATDDLPAGGQLTVKPAGAVAPAKKGRVQFAQQAQRFQQSYGDEDLPVAPAGRGAGGPVWFGVRFWENVGTAIALGAVGAFLYSHRE